MQVCGCLGGRDNCRTGHPTIPRQIHRLDLLSFSSCLFMSLSLLKLIRGLNATEEVLGIPEVYLHLLFQRPARKAYKLSFQLGIQSNLSLDWVEHRLLHKGHAVQTLQIVQWCTAVPIVRWCISFVQLTIQGCDTYSIPSHPLFV